MKIWMILLVVCFSGVSSRSAPNSGLLLLPEEWVPYVERVRPEEILLLEQKLAEPLSERSELLVYSGDSDGIIHVAYSLRSEERGYVLELTIIDPETREPRKRARLLPRDIAHRLSDSIELALTKQVFPVAPIPAPHPDNHSVIWLFLRRGKDQVALGKVMVPITRCWVGLPDSNRPLLEVIYQMRRCLDGPIGGPPAPLIDLDIAARGLHLAYLNR
jgi:hypothetical protein